MFIHGACRARTASACGHSASGEGGRRVRPGRMPLIDVEARVHLANQESVLRVNTPSHCTDTKGTKNFLALCAWPLTASQCDYRKGW
jgi:hypothetical protein